MYSINEAQTQFLTLFLISKQFDNNILREIASVKKGQEVKENVKNFAVTLHFYSPRAYSFVRKTFGNQLPHPRSITRWYASVEGNIIIFIYISLNYD